MGGPGSGRKKGSGGGGKGKKEEKKVMYGGQLMPKSMAKEHKRINKINSMSPGRRNKAINKSTP